MADSQPRKRTVKAKRAAKKTVLTGEATIKGEQGIPGKTVVGKRGIPGQGKQGVQGIQGKTGTSITGKTGSRGAKGEPGRTSTAAASANALAAALTGFTTELRKVKQRSLLVLAVAVVAVLGVLLSFYVRYDSRISSCHRDNQLRGALLNVADLVDGFGNDPDTQAFVLQMRHDFAKRDCSAIAWI